jgi:putative transposase
LGELNQWQINNALGVNDELLTQHSLFLALGVSTEERQAAYRALFEAHLDEKTLEEVRSSINKAWVLGSEHFKQMIETRLNRRASPIPKGGDRKSVKYGKS